MYEMAILVYEVAFFGHEVLIFVEVYLFSNSLSC